jgi:hypothetical protein
VQQHDLRTPGVAAQQALQSPRDRLGAVDGVDHRERARTRDVPVDEYLGDAAPEASGLA